MSRWFKSSCLPKEQGTALPCLLSPVPATVLPTSSSASMVFAWLHRELGCAGEATAEKTNQFSLRAECRSSGNCTKTCASKKAKKEQGLINAAERGWSLEVLIEQCSGSCQLKLYVKL